ncbi:hypothetical protein [Citrobacter phage Ci1]|nr:hypothetical protein [Citrobacter phage Ci1]
MLMIQGTVLKEENREIKKGDQVSLQFHEKSYVGCVSMISNDSKRKTWIISCIGAQIHASLSIDELGYIDVEYKVFREDGVFIYGETEAHFKRMHSPGKTYEVNNDSKLRFYTEEQVKVKEERELKITDVLRYSNDGCQYDILYISAEGNMIVKEQKSGLERVINKKDRKLQISFGIRNA